MKNLVVSVKDKQELDFISQLLKKLGMKARVISESEMEDLGLLKMMEEADRSKKVGRDEIMKALGE